MEVGRHVGALLELLNVSLDEYHLTHSTSQVDAMATLADNESEVIRLSQRHSGDSGAFTEAFVRFLGERLLIAARLDRAEREGQQVRRLD